MIDDQALRYRRVIMRRARVLGTALILLAVVVSILLESGIALFALQGAGLVVWIGTAAYLNLRYGPDVPKWADKKRPR